jgi:hypothetical protein
MMRPKEHSPPRVHAARCSFSCKASVVLSLPCLFLLHRAEAAKPFESDTRKCSHANHKCVHLFFYASHLRTGVASVHEHTHANTTHTHTSLTPPIHKQILQLHLDMKIASFWRSPTFFYLSFIFNLSILHDHIYSYTSCRRII